MRLKAGRPTNAWLTCSILPLWFSGTETHRAALCHAKERALIGDPASTIQFPSFDLGNLWRGRIDDWQAKRGKADWRHHITSISGLSWYVWPSSSTHRFVQIATNHQWVVEMGLITNVQASTQPREKNHQPIHIGVWVITAKNHIFSPNQTGWLRSCGRKAHTGRASRESCMQPRFFAQNLLCETIPLLKQRQQIRRWEKKYRSISLVWRKVNWTEEESLEMWPVHVWNQRLMYVHVHTCHVMYVQLWSLAPFGRWASGTWVS